MDKLTNFYFEGIDRGVLAVTSLLGFISIAVEDINLYLAVAVKFATLINILVYLMLNYKRILMKIRSLFKKVKNEKRRRHNP